jgi:maltooligosyltrehalose trehalohydrolase
VNDATIGATFLGQTATRFTVWAPFREQVAVHLIRPRDQILPLRKDERGYFVGTENDIPAGSQYYFRLDDECEYPDPASRFQPDGVHGPSQVTGREFPWRDDRWQGLPLQNYIIYELHVGTFSPEGTFDSLIGDLDRLVDLGVTAVELMPVAQFPGDRNWGYDGVYPYAVQSSYGGPDGLKRLVDACHGKNLAVVLDVVYNHLGPEGNNLARFGPYFTDRYRTPWGNALNFDGAYSDEVRRFFIENALYWLTEFHFDALRLDALHAIVDNSAYTFIEELAASVHDRTQHLKRRICVMAESAANDARLVRNCKSGGCGLDAQWNDDFHHSLHVLLTGETAGYYQDFGNPEQMAKAYTDGFVYSGEYSAFRKRRHGTSSRDIPAERFVVFSQNHDQVGNRARGERLTGLVSLASLKVAAGMVLLSPFIPLLFMGEEYGETAPFPYFVNHTDAALIEAVRRGRCEEFAAFNWQGKIPDPQAEATFLSAKLNGGLREHGEHKTVYEFYRQLIKLRKAHPALASLSKENMLVWARADGRTLFIHRWSGEQSAIIVHNLNSQAVSSTYPIPAGKWRKLLDSEDIRWQGAGGGAFTEIESDGQAELALSPRSFVVLTNQGRS